ncbi:MAG TPA: hypothetical protein VFU49_03250 [Ktedonobacteraceae bacterium]|nr:hypothetical protein [Ktedonobacteraceae bacterium]
MGRAESGGRASLVRALDRLGTRSRLGASTAAEVSKEVCGGGQQR